MSSIVDALNLAKAGVIYAPASFLTANLSLLKVVCNGCGKDNSKFDFVPDSLFGTSIAAACFIHDWMYYVGRSIEDKEEADRVFLNNMNRLIERDSYKWYKPTWLQRLFVVKYYQAVKHFGGVAFWNGRN